MIKTKTKQKKRSRRSRGGYSLLEILVVLAIISLIAGATALALFKFIPEAKIKTTRTSALTVRSAANLYRMEHNTSAGDDCPTVDTLTNAQLLDEATKKTDAWDTPFILTCDDRGIHVSSAGPDKRQGTADDIRVPDPPTAVAAASHE